MTLLLSVLSAVVLVNAWDSRAAEGDSPLAAAYHAAETASRLGWQGAPAREAGTAWETLGDDRQALAFWERVALGDAGLATLQRLAQAYLELERWVDASLILEHLLRDAPSHSWALLQRALLQSAQRSPSASAAVDALGDEYPDLSAALRPALSTNQGRDIGRILVGRRLWSFGELALRYDMLMHGEAPELLALLGWARSQQGKSAEFAFNRALALSPDNPQTLLLYGLYRRAEGDLAGSLSALSRAAMLDASNPVVMAELAVAFEQNNQPKQAEDALRQAVLLSGSAPVFQSLLDAFLGRQPTMASGTGLTQVNQEETDN